MTHICLIITPFGKGVQALINIDKGKKILDFKGPVLNRCDLPSPYNEKNDYYLQIGPDSFLGPSGELDDYVNHSCNPNSGIVFKTSSIELVAIKPIKKNEQIFYDYSTTMDNFGWKMKCHCKSTSCREWIDDFFNIPHHTQQYYIEQGIVPDYIVKKLH